MPLNLAYSFSRIQAFACPFRFHKLYIEKAHEPPSAIAVVGQVSHAIMKEYLAWLYENHRMFSLKVLDQCAARAFSEMDRRDKWPPGFTEEDKQEVMRAVDDLVAGIQDAEFSIDPNVRAYWTEQKLAFDRHWNLLPDDAWFEKNVYFRAVIDWAWVPQDENTLVIVDHKSGWGDPDPHQLPYYAWAGYAGLGKEHGINRVSVKLNFLAKGAKIEEGGFYSPEDLLKVGEDIDATIEEIEFNEDWDPKPGAQCSYCGFTAECPAINSSWIQLAASKAAPAQSFTIDSPQKAEKGLELLVLVQARLKELEKALNAWVVEHGPIKAAGKVMEQREVEKWLLTDPYGFQRALMDYGIHPSDILASTGISKSALYNLLKKHKAQRHYGELVEAYGAINRETRKPGVYNAPAEDQ
ncbi:MAG: PD-(D/E)XK nuclease family protein [Deltaproteobacteria bacterium]|nr:PD-(D/E)XK nuclease family protein [Deltaproteobacteria bacterium]